jgi:hypothetical protein
MESKRLMFENENEFFDAKMNNKVPERQARRRKISATSVWGSFKLQHRQVDHQHIQRSWKQHCSFRFRSF